MDTDDSMSKYFYRVTLLVANLDLGWVGLDFDVPLSAGLCLGRWEFGKNCHGQVGNMMEYPNQSQVGDHQSQPVCCVFPFG